MINNKLSFEENLNRLDKPFYKKIAYKFIETSQIDDKYKILLNSESIGEIFIICALIMHSKSIGIFSEDENLLLSNLFNFLGEKEKEYTVRNWGLNTLLYLGIDEVSAVNDILIALSKNRNRLQITILDSFKSNLSNFSNSIYEEIATNLVHQGEILEKHKNLLENLKERETFFLVSILLFNTLVDSDETVSRYFYTEKPYTYHKFPVFVKNNEEYKKEIFSKAESNYYNIKEKYHIDKIEELFLSFSPEYRFDFISRNQNGMIGYLGLDRLASIRTLKNKTTLK